MKQGYFSIIENVKLTENVFKMTLKGDVSNITQGQFINIKLDGLFLRRPISVCDLNNDTLTIIYKVVGKGTEVLSQMKEGTLAGTALFALYRANPVDDEIIENALIIVNDSTYSDSSFNAAFLLLEEKAYSGLSSLAMKISTETNRTIFQRNIALAVLNRIENTN